jgi:hypothetical protein
VCDHKLHRNEIDEKKVRQEKEEEEALKRQ